MSGSYLRFQGQLLTPKGKKVRASQNFAFCPNFCPGDALIPGLRLAESSESSEMPKSLTDFKLTVLGAPWELEAQKNFGRGSSLREDTWVFVTKSQIENFSHEPDSEG